MQEIICGCSGKAKNTNTRSCRCECPARIQLQHSDQYGQYTSEHMPGHNHTLTDKCCEKMHIDVYA